MRLATTSPAQAEELGAQAEQAARSERDWASVSVARRAVGVAALQQRHLDVAIDRLRSAVAAANKVADTTLTGEARMSLASALVISGDTKRGFIAINAALGELTGLPAARALAQRAAILQELGRIDDALTDLRSALPALRRHGDTAAEARVRSNRGIMLISRRQFAAAESDLLRAQHLFDELGQTLNSAYVEHNLGYLHADRGDVPTALAHFDNAAERYEQLGLRVGALYIDRAKLLLSVWLISEAREAADEAVLIFTEQRSRVHLPDAQLVLSTVALVQRDFAAALDASRKAAHSFAQLGRPEWLALARFADLQAQAAAVRRAREENPDRGLAGAAGLAAQLSAAADALRGAGWAVPAQEAHILAAEVALLRGRRKLAQRELQLAAQARRSGPAEVRVRAWLAEARLRQTLGDRRAARSALRAGLRVVDDYRASFGAAELRAHVSVHRGALASAGLRMALADGDARAAHWWSECGRATAYSARPARPPDNPELARDLEDLRATMAEIETVRGQGDSTTTLVARQVRLERAIRDRSRRVAGDGTAHGLGPPTVPELAEDLHDTVLVEFIDLDGLLHAITVTDGRARLHGLGPSKTLRHWTMHLPFALHRLARATNDPASVAAAERVIQRAGAEIDEALFRPVSRQLGDRPLLLVPAPWLQAIPWSVVPSCRGRPVSVSPSAAMWRAAVRRRPPADPRVVAIAGPRLTGAVREASAVARTYPGAVLMTGASATTQTVGPVLDGAALAHIAAHGIVRADNPLFSSLLLDDGPYTVYDIERLGQAPHHTVVAACNSAVSQITAGEEILGLAAALLSQQTATLVASVVPVPDAETVDLMADYHRLLRLGHTPAAALADAQQTHAASPHARASAAGFVCLGAGHEAATWLT